MELKFILESLLFSAQKPLSVAELREVLAAAGKGPNPSPKENQNTHDRLAARLAVAEKRMAENGQHLRAAVSHPRSN